MRFMLLLLLLLLPASLQGQTEGLEEFGEVIDVRVLNLEVAVTGKDGEHVPGLGPEEFRLFVDDDEVPIEYFSEIRQGSAARTASEEISAVPSVTPGEVVGTSFLLFVDNFFGHERDRDLVLDEILGTLPDLGPRDRMAVVSFDGKRLDLVSSWSASPEAIGASLRAVKDQEAFGLLRLAEAGRFQAQLKSYGAGLIEESTLNIKTEYVRQLSRQVDTVVSAAITAMRTMASPPGRKVLLLMSGGWPDDPTTYAVGYDDTKVRLRTERYSPKETFVDLSSTANLLGYTIYPIDLPGKQATGPGQDLAPDALAFTRSADRENELEMPMLALARKTGGQAMINGLRKSVMVRTLEDTGSYYWLGYTPQWAHDDEEHEVRVEVLRPGVKSRSREGFRDLSRKAEVTMMVESNLLFSTPLSDHTLEVELGRPKKAGRGRILLPVSLKVPLDNVVMLPVARGFEAKLELRVAVMDAEGARSEIPVIPVTIGGEHRPPPGGHAVYDTSIKLRRVKQRLALALYDLVGEQILSTSMELDPESM